jgi:hypothetical protein
MAARERARERDRITAAGDKATDIATTEAQIATNIRNFLAHHKSKGSRRKCEQDAIDAVLVACTFSDVEDSKNRVGDRLNALKHKVQECKVWGKRLRDKDERFEPEERKKRSDCYRDAAKESVLAFCHSDEGSTLDTTSSSKGVNIPNPETGKPEKHPLRLWNIPGLDKRHKSFLLSETYKRFIEINVGQTIGTEVFRLSVCKCVRDPQKTLQGLAARNAEYSAKFRKYEAELKTILGVDSVTVNCLTDALEQRNLSLAGLKHEKAERLVSHHRNLTS